MTESLESGTQKISLWQAITDYIDCSNDESRQPDAVQNLSLALSYIWKEMQWGNVDNPQAKKADNIRRSLEEYLSASFQLASNDEWASKTLAIIIEDIIQSIREDRPILFITYMCRIFGLCSISWELMVVWHQTYRPIFRNDRLLVPTLGSQKSLPKTHELSWNIQNLVWVSLGGGLQKRNRQKPWPDPLLEKRNNLILYLSQLIVEFKSLVQALPIDIFQNFEKYQTLEQELSAFKRRLLFLREKRQRHEKLQKIIQNTRNTMSTLSSRSIDDPRRQRRLGRNEEKLEKQEEEVESIKISQLNAQIKTLEVKMKKQEERLHRLRQSLYFTRRSLQQYIHKALHMSYTDGDKEWSVIQLTHLTSKVVWIITQITYDLFPLWKGVKQNLNTLLWDKDTNLDEISISQKKAQLIMQDAIGGMYSRLSKPKLRRIKR